MSLVNQSIIKHKMGLLNLAEELQNVSQACRGECQGSCRLIQAAAFICARGGLRTTRPIGVQLRVLRLQRSGFAARAR